MSKTMNAGYAFSVVTPREHEGASIHQALELLGGGRFTLYRGKHVLRQVVDGDLRMGAALASSLETAAVHEVEAADLRIGTEFWIEGSDPAKGIMIALRSRPELLPLHAPIPPLHAPIPAHAKPAPLPTFVSLGFASAHLTAEQSAREEAALAMFKDLATFIAAGPSSRLTSLAMTSLQQAWVLFREANAEPSIAEALGEFLRAAAGAETASLIREADRLARIASSRTNVGDVGEGSTIEERALDLDRKTRPR